MRCGTEEEVREKLRSSRRPLAHHQWSTTNARIGFVSGHGLIREERDV